MKIILDNAVRDSASMMTLLNANPELLVDSDNTFFLSTEETLSAITLSEAKEYVEGEEVSSNEIELLREWKVIK